jgi:alpha-tubulin suppressor-like RCC1 family protein
MNEVDNDEGWLLSEPFDSPINISALIRRKISKIALGEKEMIVEAKKEFFLLNWGSKKLLDASSLTRINTYASCQFDALFEAFLIQAAPPDAFHYSPEKKVDNSNRLYHIDSRTSVITGYPTAQAVRMPTRVKGISVGKYHCLCWDDAGKLYSWGCRSLGLGYGVFPSEVYHLLYRKLSNHPN